jgi:SH3 domain protein
LKTNTGEWILSMYIKKAEAHIIGLLLILLAATSTQAETRYIDDTLYAPLRSGEGLGFRIVHKGVKSGTALELLATNAESGYSKVRTPEGIEGWLPSRYLVSEPIARTRLDSLTNEYESLRKKFAEVAEQNKNMQETNNTITEKNRELSESNKNLLVELADIKRISTNAITLDRRNSELRELNEQLKNELEVLTSENTRLKENNERDKMLLGGGLVLSGVLVAVILPMFKRDKRDAW